MGMPSSLRVPGPPWLSSSHTGLLFPHGELAVPSACDLLLALSPHGCEDCAPDQSSRDMACPSRGMACLLSLSWLDGQLGTRQRGKRIHRSRGPSDIL